MENVHSETIGKYTINIFQDDRAGNPFENWDGEPPIAVYSDRTITEYATKYGHASEVPTLTREQIKANLKDILGILGVNSLWGLRDRQYTGQKIADIINDGLVDIVTGVSNSERLELLEELYTMAGVPALLQTVHGYCQGDWAQVLAVATPKFQDACGNAEGYWDNPEALAPSIELYRDWAFGNVYAFTITDQNGEEVDALGGMFGDYDAENGALSEARELVQGLIDAEKFQRVRQLKSFG
jgi:hypothetical protein